LVRIVAAAGRSSLGQISHTAPDNAMRSQKVS